MIRVNFQVARGGSSSITEIIEEFGASSRADPGFAGFHVRQADGGFRVFPSAFPDRSSLLSLLL